MRDLDERAKRDSQFDSFLGRLPGGRAFDDGDRAALRTLARYAKAFPDKHVFQHYGDEKPDAVLILDGMAVRVRVSEKGHRRILGFVLPGELSIAPTTAPFANYELVALGPCIAVRLPWRDLKVLERDHTNIRRFLEWYAHKEICSLENKFVAMSGAPVEEKLRYLLEDIYSRLEKVDKAVDRRMSLPLRQRDLADAVGASIVQVSKVLSRMRRNGVLDLEFAPSGTRVSLGAERERNIYS